MVTDFSALQCMVRCKFTYFIRNGKWVGIYMIKRDLFVLLLVFYAYTTRRADRMGSEWSCKNQNSSYRVEFQ